MPGCQIATFDVAIQLSDVREFYSCRPQATVKLVGNILDSALLEKKPAEIAVEYLAAWACDFFGLPDCLVPQILLGTVKPDASVRFEMSLPDFGADPTSSQPGGAELEFVLREAETWNPIAFLQPGGRSCAPPLDSSWFPRIHSRWFSSPESQTRQFLPRSVRRSTGSCHRLPQPPPLWVPLLEIQEPLQAG